MPREAFQDLFPSEDSRDPGRRVVLEDPGVEL
jgi:hypothetical protein